MTKLEDITVGSSVKGIISNSTVTIVAVQWYGNNVLEITYKDSHGQPGNQMLLRDEEINLTVMDNSLPWSFDADGEQMRLASEAYRISLAHLFDPYLAVHTSSVEPLPHQISAVYQEMLPKLPLRYVLADDPGAGKTIMTGLFIKELIARGDLKRCLIVSPGSLVEQWQDELFSKFHLTFQILTNDRMESAVTGNVFNEVDFCICRLDKLARNEQLQEKLKVSEWDLIVCDEAHKMSATIWGGEVKYTKRFQLGKLLSNITKNFLLLTATPHNGKDACGCEMPLASSFVLSKKNGKEAWIEPQFDYEAKKITYKVQLGKGKIPEAPKTARGAKFKCIMCSETTTDDYIKQESVNGRMGSVLMGIVAEGKHGRLYVSPTEEHVLTAQCSKPEGEYPEQRLPYDPRNIWCVNYGLDTYDKLFTNRQLTALTTFSELVSEAQAKAEADAVAAGMKNDHLPLRNGGDGARAYGEAVGVYLAFVISKLADRGSTICGWDSSREGLRNTFGRQAIPMTWDYSEGNPFSNSSGCFDNMIEWVTKCISELPAATLAEVSQADAQSDCGLRNIMISTDPPYYDNIGYADLSDFFYVWMRQSLKDTYPELFSTMLVPKVEELIATPYRHDGSVENAKSFFEDGMLSACKQMYRYAREDVPVTIYYAYKQSDTDDRGTASSGWETMLGAIVNAGFAITGTWPMRTEMANRSIASGTNALASSIVLVCRKRPEDAPQTTRRNLIAALRRELRPALQKLQSSNIAPVDLAQSAIGPGMSVFSCYRRVLEADGSVMSVRSALQVINEEVDLYFNEQVGSLDAASRFCVDLYTQCAYNNIKYGEAEILANAKSTSIPMMAAHGVLYAKAGVVHLMERSELPTEVDSNESTVWLLTQQLTHAMATGGIEACAKIVWGIFGSGAESAKDLAYRLYTIAERKGWTEEGYAYNALVVAWPDIQSRAAAMKAETPEQITLFDMEAIDS